MIPLSIPLFNAFSQRRRFRRIPPRVRSRGFGKRADPSRPSKELPSRAPRDLESGPDPPVAGKIRRDFTRRVALSNPVSSLDGLERAEVGFVLADVPRSEVPLILVFIPYANVVPGEASRFSRRNVAFHVTAYSVSLPPPLSSTKSLSWTTLDVIKECRNGNENVLN